MLYEQQQTGDLELDLASYQVRRGGTVLHIEKIPMELLIYLVESREKLVSRESIVERLWGKDVFLDTEQGINTAVRKLRLALHDNPERPRFVQTVVGKGYRFIGAINVIGNGLPTAVEPQVVPAPAIVQQPERGSLEQISFWRKSKVVVGAALVLVLGMLGTWYWVMRHRVPPEAIRSIAVLPLQNLSGDPSQEYFADGTTEELITTLAKLTDLRVTSRTSSMQFKGAQKSTKEIGRLLNVDAIVEGSVARSADAIRITVQLIDVHADKHLWAAEYHASLSDVLSQQEEIARDVALNLSAKIPTQDQARPPIARPVNPQAHDLYLRARQLAAKYDQPSMQQAFDLYQQAIQLQPDYAAAYVGVADAYAMSAIQDTEKAWPQVRDAASKALSLDSSVVGAHAKLATVKHIYDWDTAGAEEEFKRALQTDRDNADTHITYALFLAQIGRVEEGLSEAQLAEELDPLSSRISGTKEKLFMIARRYDDVFKQAKRTRELNPQSYVTALHVLETYQLLGKYEESIDEGEAHPEPGGESPEENTAYANKLRSALRSQGPKGYWDAVLRGKLDIDADDHCLLAYDYLRTGDKENGYRQLDLAIKQRDRNLRQMKTHPMWDFVRDDPRFQDVLRRVGY